MLTLSHACLSLSEKDTPPRTPSIPIPNMNSDLYNRYLDYLSNLNNAESLDGNLKQKIEKTAINYFISNNILYQRHHGKNRLVVPEHKKQMILEASHDHQLAGYMRIDNTFQRLSDKYYWAIMYEDIRKYIKTCDTCQKRRKEKEVE